jgi:hypothetical protein
MIYYYDIIMKWNEMEWNEWNERNETIAKA